MGIGELVAFTGTKGPFDLGEDSTGTGELGSKADEGRWGRILHLCLKSQEGMPVVEAEKVV